LEVFDLSRHDVGEELTGTPEAIKSSVTTSEDESRRAKVNPAE
jgi:hypothetical protein